MLGPTSLHIPLKIAGDSKVSKGVLYVRYIVAWTSGDKKKISPEMGDQPMCDGDLELRPWHVWFHQHLFFVLWVEQNKILFIL